MDDRFRSYVAVYLLLVNSEDKLLLSLRQATGYEDGKYSLVAGHIDGAESATQAMIREAKEEAGVTISPDALKCVCTCHRKGVDREYIDLFFTCKNYLGEVENLEPEKCGDLRFFALDDLPDNMIEYIRKIIHAITKGRTYVEYGWH